MAFTVEFTERAEEQILALDKKTALVVGKKIKSLELYPEISGVRKLQGHNNLFRLRSGVYRVVFTIHEDRLVILVVRVAHRKDVYRNLPKIV